AARAGWNVTKAKAEKKETSVADRVFQVNRLLWIAALVFVLAPAMTAAAQDRLPPLAADKMTEEQKKAVAEIAAQNNGTLPTYLNPFVRNPEVMKRVNGLGDYVVRAKTALSRKQNELVILLVIRDWSQKYMWSNHQQAALRAGLAPEIVGAIGE